MTLEEILSFSQKSEETNQVQEQNTSGVSNASSDVSNDVSNSVSSGETKPAGETVSTGAESLNLGYSPDELVQFAKVYNEFRSDPYGFLARYVPELLPKDDYSWVKNALKKEFGEDFIPDPQEALVPGTKSNLYFVRTQQLILEHQNALKKQIEQQERQRKEFEEKFARDKSELMKKYSLDEEGFKKFWEKLETTEVTLDMLYKAVYFDEIVEKIRQEVAEQIKKELSNAVPPSPAQIKTEGSALDKDLADFGFIVKGG